MGLSGGLADNGGFNATAQVDGSGTHAARPAAGSVGNNYIYFETDTGAAFQAQGGSWVQVAIATAPVSSVFGRTGAVVLTKADVTGTGLAAADVSALASGTRLDQLAAPTANVALNAKKITGLANGTASTDAAAFGQVPTVGGVGTPPSVGQSLTAGSANLVSGTSIALTTGSLVVGQRFRFHLSLSKTGAGTATWQVFVKYGTANSTADGAIATWTSGTNTALVDVAILIIEVVITALGSGTSATANCLAFYGNSYGSAVTGLGSLGANPGSTSGFDSTATSPFLHIDITPGASAVMSAVAMAEQIR